MNTTTLSKSPRDAEGVPMYRVGDELYYRPGALAINGMKRIDAYLDTGDTAQLEQEFARLKSQVSALLLQNAVLRSQHDDDR